MAAVEAKVVWREWADAEARDRCRGSPLASDPADDGRALQAPAAREGRLVRRPSPLGTDPQRLLHAEWHRTGGACWRFYLAYPPPGDVQRR